MTKKQFWMLAFLVILFVPNLFMAYSIHRSRGKDFRAFFTAADRLLEKSYIYEGSKPGSCVTWPLFFPVFMLPWALMAKVNIHATQILWYCANCVVLFFTIGIWCSIVYGKKFDWFDFKKPLSVFSSFIFLPILFIATPLTDNASELQVNILQLFLVSLGIYSVHRDKEITSGLWFGLATAIKAYPLIFLIYLLFRGKFKGAAVLLITAALLTLTPILWYGPHDYLVNLQGWVNISAHGGFPLGGAQQSVYSMLGTWITSDIHTMLHGKIIHPPLDTIGSQLTIWIHRSLFAALLAAFFFIVRSRRFRDTGFEGAFFMLMMILFSPVAWKHYWVMSFPAVFVLWKVVLTEKNRVINWLLWISFFLIPVLEVFGSAVRPFRAFANSVMFNYTMAGSVLLAGLLYWISAQKITREQRYPTPSRSVL